MATMKATREAYGEALKELGASNDKIVVLDADLSKSTMTNMFAKAYPDRFYNVGVAECNLVGIASGLSLAGFVPFCSTFAIFASGRAWEQVRNTVGYPHLNVKIGGSHAGLTVGEDGASHQALEDLALMRVIPGMTVVAPADAVEMRLAVHAAAEYVGPVYLRFGRPKVPVIFGADYQFKLGRGHLLQQGKDLLLTGTGLGTQLIAESLPLFANAGLHPTALHLPTIKPLDRDLLVAATQGVKAVLTVEEHSIIGGLGSAVAEALCETRPLPLSRLGVEDTWGQSGDPDALLNEYGLTAANVLARGTEILRRS